jgi:hypothetical protein
METAGILIAVVEVSVSAPHALSSIAMAKRVTMTIFD